MKTSQLNFISQDTRCVGTLIRPEFESNPPIILMAQGFGMIRDAGLPAFAERFAKEGYAVFYFDYRGFGDSEGQPRHWVSPKRHIEDWQAALNFIQTLPNIDTKRIALWGYSFSGGHAIQTAAKHPNIEAVVLQAPHVSGLSSLTGVPLTKLLKLSMAGIADLVSGAIGKPVYRPIVGREHDVAAMTAFDAWDGYMSQLPANANWENKVRARIFLEISMYNPIFNAHHLKMPVRVISGSRDSIIPESAIRKATEKMPNVEYTVLDSNHFELCTGQVFDKNIALQIIFLKEKFPINAKLKVVA